MERQSTEEKEESSDVRQFHAIVAEKEPLCRAAAVSALTKTFQPDRVYGVADSGEVTEKLQDLSIKRPGDGSVIIVFLEASECSSFSQQKHPVPTFLVSLSDSVTEAVAAGASREEGVHCTLPRMLDAASLASFTETFQAWSAAQDSVKRASSFHDAAAKNKEKRAARPGGRPQRTGAGLAVAVAGAVPPMAPPAPVSPSAAPPPIMRHAMVPEKIEGPREGVVNGYMDLAGQKHSGFTPVAESSEKSLSQTLSDTDRGNSLNSLSLLRPARKPFEDVHIVEVAGRGSFGTVYKARWDSSIVALKVIEHNSAPSPNGASATFEGALAASLAHPNLVQTFKHSIRESAQRPGKCCEVWIVQEWCGMGSLGDDAVVQKILALGGYADVVETACEIASAGSYLHSRGIIHGDLSRNNVLLHLGYQSKGFVAKICDFGLARVLGDKDYIETMSMGTVYSMPPELFVIEGAALTTKVDVYAFGVLLWVLGSGKSPFENKTPPQIIVQVAAGQLKLEPPQKMPDSVAKMFKACISREPNDRPEFESLLQVMLEIITRASKGQDW